MTVQRLHVEKRFSEIAISGNLVHLAGQLATDLKFGYQRANSTDLRYH